MRANQPAERTGRSALSDHNSCWRAPSIWRQIIGVGLRSSSICTRIGGAGGVAAERLGRARGGGTDDPAWRLSSGPHGYVSGEASAVARYLHEGVAVPVFSSVPMARRGPSGRPTVVLQRGDGSARRHHHARRRRDLEVSRLGVVPRPAARDRWRAPSPSPGASWRWPARRPSGRSSRDAGVDDPPAAVLVGGYAGTWISGHVAWHTPMEPAALACLGASRGCGLLGVLPHGACGLRGDGAVDAVPGR